MAIETYFKNIADAIREKGGTSALITPGDMPQAILDLPSGGGGVIASWDFTESLIDSIGGKAATLHGSATRSNTGIEIGSTSAYSRIPCLARENFKLEVTTGQLSLTGTAHHRFIMFSSDSGLIYRSASVWSFYDGSAWASNSTINDFDFFSDCAITIEIDANRYWHIYKDSVLVYEPSLPMPYSYPITLGASSNSCPQSAFESLVLSEI